MQVIGRFKIISFFLIAAYLLAACGGTLPAAQQPKTETQAITFSGVVQSMDGNQWTVGGQTVTLDSQAALDPTIAVGDTVSVQANVAADGSVVVRKVESSSKDNAVSMPSDPSSAPVPGDAQNEIVGTLEAITADTMTIDGVSYNLADFTEIKGNLIVGDPVKVHVIVNADGSFTIREIERSAATTSVDESSSNSNGSDDGPNHDLNDDHSDNSNGSEDSSNHDSNDDHGGGSGDSNSGGSN